MSDHADIVREWIGGCLALHGFREDCPACVAYRDANAALDALVAERDDLRYARKSVDHYRTECLELENRAEAAEAEVARLRKALTQIAHPTTNNLTDADLCRRFARAALAKEDTA